jgi:ribosomal protein S27E
VIIKHTHGATLSNTNMKHVTKTTRASKDGKFIYCPKCGAVARVFHFSWSALGCCSCNEMIPKYDWLLEDPCIPRGENRMVFSLVFDRNYTDFVFKFNEKYLHEHGYYLDEVDASGSRTVWCCLPLGSSNYEDAIDFPQWMYDDFRQWLLMRHRMKEDDFSICRRMPDPGLGIMLPEDFELLKKGGTPDGCIRVTT